MKKLLSSDKIIIRFVGLYLLSVVLLFISWFIAYYFLPEALLKGGTPLSRLAGDIAAAAFREAYMIFQL